MIYEPPATPLPLTATHVPNSDSSRFYRVVQCLLQIQIQTACIFCKWSYLRSTLWCKQFLQKCLTRILKLVQPAPDSSTCSRQAHEFLCCGLQKHVKGYRNVLGNTDDAGRCRGVLRGQRYAGGCGGLPVGTKACWVYGGILGDTQDSRTYRDV